MHWVLSILEKSKSKSMGKKLKRLEYLRQRYMGDFIKPYFTAFKGDIFHYNGRFDIEDYYRVNFISHLESIGF